MRQTMRLDLFMSEHGYADSRTDAKNFITGGYVKVDGRTVTKPAFEVSDEPDTQQVPIPRATTAA